MVANKKIILSSLEKNGVLELFDLIPVHIYWKSKDGYYWGCNRNQAEDIGLNSSDDIIGKTDYDLLSHKAAEELRRNDQEIMKSGAPATIEEDDYISTKIPLYDENNRVIGILGVSINFRIFKNSRTILDKIISAVPGHVYWKDLNGVILGCNEQQAVDAGFKNRYEVIGKRAYDLINPSLPEEIKKQHAEAIDIADNAVMQSGVPQVFEEFAVQLDGAEATWLSEKTPLYDDDGKITGLLGISVDITELKKAKEEAEVANKEKLEAALEAARLKTENEKQKVLLEQEEKFTKIANQVAHDIRSPLASLLMIVKSCTHIPESERIALREAAIGIGDIANHLLDKYKNKEADSIETEERKLLLVSTALSELLTAKKYQYKNLPIKFDCHFEGATGIIFIKSEFSAFKRMLSNLINNAVDALEGSAGTVSLHLAADQEWVKITLQDTGKGMPPELIAKIMNKVSVTEGKKDGHGIGLTQVWETLDKNQGEMKIESTLGKGSKLSLTFPRMSAPHWICDEIILNANDTVIILDDDASIHGAWQTRFESILNKKSTIKRKHFEEGKEALEFINALSSEEKNTIFLLSDYELLKQELNGLHIIAKTGIKRSILVTSHYADPLVQENAAKTGTRILPKQLASEVPIKIITTEALATKDNVSNRVDIVIVEDDEKLSDNLVRFIFDDKVVDQYLKPEDLLENIHRYPKDTKIYLDNNYDNSWLKGIDVARELHEQGYERLYLLSGDVFREEKLPSYLTIIRKDDIERLEKSKNE